MKQIASGYTDAQLDYDRHVLRGSKPGDETMLNRREFWERGACRRRRIGLPARDAGWLEGAGHVVVVGGALAVPLRQSTCACGAMQAST